MLFPQSEWLHGEWVCAVTCEPSYYNHRSTVWPVIDTPNHKPSAHTRARAHEHTHTHTHSVCVCVCVCKVKCNSRTCLDTMTKQLAPWSRVLCKKLETSQLVISHTFCSVLHLQEPTTFPYPELDYSSACHCILLLWDLLCCHQHLGLPSGLVPSGFLTKTLYAVLFLPYMPCTLLFSSSFIWSCE